MDLSWLVEHICPRLFRKRETAYEPVRIPIDISTVALSLSQPPPPPPPPPLAISSQPASEDPGDNEHTKLNDDM